MLQINATYWTSLVIYMEQYYVEMLRCYSIYLWTGYEGDSKFIVSRNVDDDTTRSCVQYTVSYDL